ncbi:MAG: 50S ribosomal protein L25 [Chloroflexi bacterium]|nr:50S ribosomal protein L25 [Chloroflexota bacterium]
MKRVRAAGYVPGVVYGQGKEATPLKFREIDLVRLLRAGGASQLIELRGLKKRPVKALLREVQRHPTRRNILHVDFYAVEMDVAVRTEIPVHFVGESEAMKAGAVLIHHLDKIDIECLPGDIPEHFVVDLSSLKSVDDIIQVSDLDLPKGVTLHHEPEDLVVSLTMPRAVAAAEAAEEAEAEGEESEEAAE